MSKEAEDTIPEDIMQTAAGVSVLVVETYRMAMQGRVDLQSAVDEIVDTVAKALHTERKKWDGTSTFKRCMEK